MRLSGLKTRGLTIFPQTEKALNPCNHKYGSVATWSHCTDTIAITYPNAEINAFKSNMALTGLVNPFHSAVDVANLNATGRTRFGVYFPTDYWQNPTSNAYEIIPDYNSTAWTQSGVSAGFISSNRIGETKTTKYPNHGQEIFDLTNGLYGYDVVNGIAGQKDVLTPLIDYVSNWFYSTFGYYPSVSSYRNGMYGSSYGLLNNFLASRTSLYDYGNEYNFSHATAIMKETTTRQGDMAGTRAQVQSQCATYLQNAINVGGWYSDFTHWHTSPDTEMEDFFVNQRTVIGANDVITLDFGTAFEYNFLRDMVRRISLVTDDGKLIIVTDIKDSENLPLKTIGATLSVDVDLTGTILQGKEIKGIGDKGIRKLGTNRFSVEVPYDNRDGFYSVGLEETTTPAYLDFQLPSITSVAKSGNTITVVTDKPTNLVLFKTAVGGALYTSTILKRDNTMTTNHVIDVTGTDFTTLDVYIGAITETKQSILSTKYNL